LLDPGGNPVPPGVAGELHIAGGGLARGYLRAPGLTAAAFVPCPLGAPGERCYRTGDLARQRPDGCLEFAGRIDDQVKVRGFRVEPGEIAAVLAAHPMVREAAVVAGEAAPGDWRLSAYVVAAAGTAPSAAELREHLKARLPAYMVPSSYAALAALPLTPTGKLDRAALPALAGGGDGYAPPQTAVEELLVGIWQEVLRRAPIGVNDNLFDLGGHSLLLPQLAARIEQALQLEVPLRTLFEAPTVAQLAVVIEAQVLAQIDSLSDAEAARLMRDDGLHDDPAIIVSTEEIA
jgi:acyl carrier protein